MDITGTVEEENEFTELKHSMRQQGGTNIAPVKGFIGSKELQNKLGEEASEWLDKIDQKMRHYNELPPGRIIDKQYMLEDIELTQLTKI